MQTFCKLNLLQLCCFPCTFVFRISNQAKGIMKSKLIFVLSLTAALTVGARDKVVNTPVFAEGSGVVIPRTIIFGRTATTVGIRLRTGGYTLAGESHLVADGKTYRMTKATVFTRSQGKVVSSTELDPTVHYTYKEDSLSLEFEPLDPKTKFFDFVEKDGSDFNVSGIRLDGKLYPFYLGKPKPFPYDKDEPLKPLEPTYGTAKYACHQYTHDGTEKQIGFFGLNNIFTGAELTGYTHHGYEIQSSRTYYAPLYAPKSNQFRTLLIPGYDNTINVDETAYLASHVGRKVPEDRIIQFEGPLADIQQVYYRERGMGMMLRSSVPIESAWDVLQAKIHEIETRKDYTRRQKEFGRIMAESYYLNRYNDDAQKGLVPIQDPHAENLAILKDGRSFYLINDDAYLEYAHANNIDGAVTEWMEGFRNTMNLAKKMRGLELMPESAFDTIPNCFQQELRALNDSNRVAIERLRSTANEVIVKDTPNCTGEEFIDYVVNDNPDVVLFFDFWATWCGPCMRGINAMEPLKTEWVGRPIRFVYVTNESSPTLKWSNQINSMPGLHYRLPNAIWKEIPNLDGIPQYYIYDREGNRFYEQTGFDTIDSLKQKIEEALKL